jgi:hypothetical protein
MPMMIYCKHVFLTILIVLLQNFCNAQTTIKGIVNDFAKDEPIALVNIRNVHTGLLYTTDSSGLFSIEVKKDDLLEITHISYEALQIRISNEKNPLFYSLIMRPKTKRLMEVFVRERNPIYAADSAITQETYKLVLEKPGPEDMALSNAIMANMSKKFRQEQAFKENYSKWEKAKYINYMFNPKTLQKWTGLSGDSLDLFIETYRPTYEYLRSVNEYKYLEYIKESLKEFCSECEFRKR